MGPAHAPNAGNRRGLAMVVAGVFALSGVSVIAYAAMNQERPPEVPREEAPAVVTSTPAATPSDGPTDSSVEALAEWNARNGKPAAPAAPAAPGAPGAPGATASPTEVPVVQPQAPKPKPEPIAPVLRASPPVSLAIPAINVKSSGMLHVGQTAQGTLQVPPPGPDYDKVAWYRNSPMPGTLGPAVLVGHIDSAAKGPSVFYRLAAVRRGDRILVTRADKSVATFKVTEVKRFKKADFPTQLVYGNIDHSGLRIITCGGPFDRDTGSYVDNTVVLASLVT